MGRGVVFGMKTWFGILLGSWLVCFMAGPGRAASAVVIYSDGKPSEEIPIVERSGKAYLGASQLARILGLDRSLDLEHDKVTLKQGAHSVDILVGGTVWMRDGVAVTTDEAAFKEGNEVMVGLASADAILAQTFDKNLRWDASRGQLMVGLPSPNIIDIEVRSAPERVIATIKTIGVLRYELLPVSDNRIELLVRGGVFTKRLGFEAKGGLIERLEAAQEPEGARITVTLAAGPPAYRVFPEMGPDGIVVKVWTRTVAEIPEPELMPPRKLAWQERMSGGEAKLDVVVIDPGHGGENRGSVGATGYLEKDFNLALARKLRDALSARGMEVIMTRDDDISVALETRTEVANSVGADLFISLHANGFTSPEAKGFEVYFLSPAADDEARYVASSENGALESPAIVSDARDEVAFILWDTAQNEFVAESSYLAQLVNEELSRALPIPNRGVKQADFFVLKGAYLPGILVETAFITNPSEEAMLKDDASQQKIVGAIVSAVSKFKEDYNR
jgi:N-acetylmuramoyl-L-alanine amidase